MSDLDKAKSILEDAEKTVIGTRQDEYGDMRACHQTIADLWSVYLHGRKGNPDWLEPFEVADMMELLKIGRRVSGSNKRDNYVDSAGYAAIAGALR